MLRRAIQVSATDSQGIAPGAGAAGGGRGRVAKTFRITFANEAATGTVKTGTSVSEARKSGSICP